MTDKDYNDFAKQQLEAMRETLRTTMAFTCMCCQKQKPKGEAAGAHLYKPANADLQRAMLDKKTKMPKVATYVLCLECVDSYPDHVLHAKVTAAFGQQGLFESV
jgi:hypothetical protein